MLLIPLATMPFQETPNRQVESIATTRKRRRYTLACVLMRAGTSKGIFIHRKDLPAKEIDWAPHLISALGSRCNDASQIDGVGGGTSVTSKVAVISLSDRVDADVDFTFVQVVVGKESVCFSGTCGNLISGVAGWAVTEGLIRPPAGQTVRMRVITIRRVGLTHMTG